MTKDKVYDVYGIGNALVDMEFEVSSEFLAGRKIEKGLMTLINEDEQRELINHLKGNEHRRNGGGSAANTMVALSQLGGNGFYSCKVGSDEPGEFYLADLLKNGLDTNLNLHPPKVGTTGRCVVMITPDAERTMHTHLGISVEFSPDEVIPWALTQSKILYIEGYLVASPLGMEAALYAKKMANENQTKVAVTFSDVNMIKYFRANVEKILTGPIEIIFANETEALEFTEKATIGEALIDLKKLAKHVAITLGSKGALIYNGELEKEYHIVAPVVNAIDTNGAGDIFAGAFLYGMATNCNFAEAGRLAVMAASKLVTQFGARLNADEMSKIKERNICLY